MQGYERLSPKDLEWSQGDDRMPAAKVDCQWSLISWSGCSRTCDNGVRIGKRRFAVVASGGGKLCEGNTTFLRHCNEGPCPGMCSGFFGI